MGYKAEPCEPAHCTRCGRGIHCGEQYFRKLSGYGDPAHFTYNPIWLCGHDDCERVGMGRWKTHYCSTACEWPADRACEKM
jgi:hypothetical protein